MSKENTADDLDKEDPLYYRVQLAKLITEARFNGLEVNATDANVGYGVSINFKATNGDRCSVTIPRKEVIRNVKV